MNDDSRIYVEAGQPATLNDGAGKLTDCATLQEAPSWLGLRCLQHRRYGRRSRRLAGRSIRHTRLIGFITGRSRRDIQRFVHGMVSSRR
jgi:hypothetical protein